MTDRSPTTTTRSLDLQQVRAEPMPPSGRVDASSVRAPTSRPLWPGHCFRPRRTTALGLVILLLGASLAAPAASAALVRLDNDLADVGYVGDEPNVYSSGAVHDDRTGYSRTYPSED